MIHVLRADLLAAAADALVRSVGTDMEACTGLDRRLGERAGEEVLDRLRAFGEIPIGGAIVTPGGDLPAPLLIHAVLRSIDDPISEGSVARAFLNVLRQAAEWEVATLAVPPLGVGGGNLDAEDSARVMCAVLRDHGFAAAFPRQVTLVVSNDYEEEAFTLEVARVFAAAEPAPLAPPAAPGEPE